MTTSSTDPAHPLLHGEVYRAGAADHVAAPKSSVIILHGLFGSSSNWRGIAKQLSRHYEVHTLDLRNHGASFWSNDTTFTAMSEDVLDYIEHHQLAGTAVLGHSMGGKVAMALALAHPEKVGTLIIADIAPVEYQHNHAGLIKAMQDLPLSEITTRREADQALCDSIPDQAVRQFILQNLIFSASASSPRWRINLDALSKGMKTVFGFDSDSREPFTQPTLFIRGALSEYVQPHHQPLMARLFPNHHLVSIPNAGHWLHAEQTKQFMQEVTHFLSLHAGKD